MPLGTGYIINRVAPCMQQTDYFLPGESCLNAEDGNLTGTGLAKGADEYTDQSCQNIAHI